MRRESLKGIVVVVSKDNALTETDAGVVNRSQTCHVALRKFSATLSPLREFESGRGKSRNVFMHLR